MPPLHESL